MALRPVDLEDAALYVVGDRVATFNFVDTRRDPRQAEAISCALPDNLAGRRPDAATFHKIISLARAFAAIERGSFVWSEPLERNVPAEVMFIANKR